MCRYQHKKSKITKNQVNITPLKETDKAPITDSKKTEICEQADKEFRTIS